MIYASQFQGYFLQPSSYILLCCSSLQSKYIVYVSINLCTFRKDAKGQQCVFILCMRNNMTTHCALRVLSMPRTTTMRTAESTGMLKAQIYGCILHATHLNSHTHRQTHTRVNREDPIEEELQKKCSYNTKSGVQNLRAQSRTKATAAWQPDYCCCCCGCCPYSWLYCFSQL